MFRVGDHIEMKRRHHDSGWVPAVIVDVSENGLDYSVRFPGNRRIKEFVRQEDLRFTHRRDEDCVQFRLNEEPIIIMEPGKADFNKLPRLPQQIRPAQQARPNARRSMSQPVMRLIETPQPKPEIAGHTRVNSRFHDSNQATTGGSRKRAQSLPCDIPPPWSLNWAFFCAEFAKGLIKPPGEPLTIPVTNKENDERNDINIKAHTQVGLLQSTESRKRFYKVSGLFDQEIQNNDDSKEIQYELQPDITYDDKPIDVREGKYQAREHINDTTDAIEVSSVNINIFPNVPRFWDSATMEEWRQRINVNVHDPKR